MKKIFYLSFAALAIAGCSKELQGNEVENPVEPKVLNTYHVSANLDQTKVNIKDDLSVVWQTNDKIGLVDEAGHITPATVDETGVGQPSATFSYEAESEIDVKYAYYPYTETDGKCNQKVEGTTLTISLPASQNMAKKGSRISQNNLIMAGQADNDGNIIFKNTCAVVRIKLSGTENYARRVYVQTPDKKVSGTGTLDLADENPVFTTAAVNEIKEVATEAALNQRTTVANVNPWNGADNRLHITADGTTATDDTFEGDVYLVIPAGDYTNFCIEALGNTDPVSTDAATTVDIATTASGPLTFNAGKIRTINAVLSTPAATDFGKRANSFLIENTDGGDYCFTTMAGGTEYIDGKQKAKTLTSGYYASLLWEDCEGLVTRVRCDQPNRKIYFKVAEGKKGNAVIALRARNGKIQWSWHIWVAGSTVETRTFSGVEFMERNLGATATTVVGKSAEACGLNYEWGRKDPFPGVADFSATASVNAKTIYPIQTVTSQSGQAITWATALPYVYIWGSGNSGAEDWCNATPQDNNLWGNDGTTKPKTIYDPCPYGYRVATKGAFDPIVTKAKAVARANYSVTIKDDNDKDFVLPCSGYWRRSTNSTTMCNVGTHCWIWTMTSSTTNDILNTNYIGAAVFETTSKAATAKRSTPRRWGANIRCVKFNEDAVVVAQ